MVLHISLLWRGSGNCPPSQMLSRYNDFLKLKACRQKQVRGGTFSELPLSEQNHHLKAAIVLVPPRNIKQRKLTWTTGEQNEHWQLAYLAKDITCSTGNHICFPETIISTKLPTATSPLPYEEVMWHFKSYWASQCALGFHVMVCACSKFIYFCPLLFFPSF